VVQYCCVCTGCHLATVLLSELFVCCVYYSGESCFEVKIEADSNDITEHPHDDKPTIGVLGFLIFIHLGNSCFSMQLLLQGVSIAWYAELCIRYSWVVRLSVCLSVTRWH